MSTNPPFIDPNQPPPWATAAQPLGLLSAQDPNADQNAALNEQAQALQQEQAAETPQGQVLPPGSAAPFGEGGSGTLDMSHPNTIEAVAAGVHHSRLANMLSKVGDLLGGNTSYKLIQNADGSVDVHPQASTPGEKWGRVAQVALQGMAKGWAAGQGPGGMAKALNAGVQTGTQIAADRTKEANDLSQQYTAQNRAKILFDANHKLLVLRTAKEIYDQQRQQHLDNNTDDDRTNFINTTAKNAHADQHVFDTQEDLANAYNDPNSDLAQAEKEHRATIFHTPDPTHPERVTINITPQDRMTDLANEDWTPKQAHFDPNDLTKPVYFTDGKTIIGGHLTREALNTAQQNQENANEQVKSQYAAAVQAKKDKDAENKLKAGQTAAQFAEASAHTAQAGYYDEQTNVLRGRAPSGAALPVEDPRHPPSANFDPGTQGIAPMPKTGAYKVPAEITGAARLGEIMNESADNIEKIMAQNPDLFGKAAGLISQGKTAVGLGNSPQDQALAALMGSIQQYAQVTAGFHKFRNRAQPLETEDSALKNFRNTPEAAKAYLDSQRQAVQQTRDEMLNFQNYGTQLGPSDAARQKAAAKDQRWAPKKAPDPPPPVGAVQQLRNKTTGIVDRWINNAGQVIDATGKAIDSTRPVS